MRTIDCFIIVTGILWMMSCSSDKFETEVCAGVSYAQIKPLINTRCATAGCHVQGFQPGDFTDDAVLKKKVTDGKLQMMVFDLNLMPPQDKLTNDEKSILKCWIENGAGQN